MDLTGRGMKPETMKALMKMDFLVGRRKSVGHGIATSFVEIKFQLFRRTGHGSVVNYICAQWSIIIYRLIIRYI
jgi:hypothetical protein